MNLLSKEEADVLIHEKNGRADRSAYSQYNITVYLLSDSTVLVNDHDHYVLYESVRALDAVLKGHQPMREFLYGKNPYGKDFPARTADLKATVLRLFGLDVHTLVNEALLIRLDSVLMARKDAAVVKDKYFLHLLALVGQLIADEKGAVWEMELSGDGVTWNPHLRLHGWRIVLIAPLVENLQRTGAAEGHGPLHLTYLMIGDIIRVNNP